MEAAWFVRACEVLEIPRERLILHSHTTTPQVFAPEIALAVCEELERIAGRPWYEVMHRHGLAEYETYAAFSRHKWTGVPKVEPRDFTTSLVLTQWHSPADTSVVLDQLRSDETIRYFCVQSKLDPSHDRWRETLLDKTGLEY
jgi:hypothetical protein